MPIDLQLDAATFEPIGNMIRARLGICNPSGLTGFQFAYRKFRRTERSRASSARAAYIERDLRSTVKLKYGRLRTDLLGLHARTGSNSRWFIGEARRPLAGAPRNWRRGVGCLLDFDLENRKSPRHFWRGLNKLPAASYSPTQLPTQYHRRRRA